MKQPDATCGTTVSRQSKGSLNVVTVSRAIAREYFITACVPSLGSVQSALDKAIGFAGDQGAQVLCAEVFGSGPVGSVDLAAEPSLMLTGSVRGIEAVHVWAIRGPKVHPILQHGRVVGSHWEDDLGRYARLVSVIPTQAALSPAGQAEQVFDLLAEALAVGGLDFTDTVRTWFYNDRITAWYADFNRVRNSFFRANGVYDRLVPASTGIGSSNAYGTALAAGLWAIRPKGDSIRIRAVESPLQRPALEYGSSFSRAVEAVFPDHRRLYISGTASIDPEGRTCHVGDPAAQTDLTLRVVAEILRHSRYMWSEVNRSVVYLKEASCQAAYEGCVGLHGLPAFPRAVTRNGVCRDDLLFEIECDAIHAG